MGRCIVSTRILLECDDDDDDDEDDGGGGGERPAGRGEASLGEGCSSVEDAIRDIGGDWDQGLDSLALEFGDMTAHDGGGNDDDAPAPTVPRMTTTTTIPDGNANIGANAMTKLAVLAALAGSTAAFAPHSPPVAVRTQSRAASSDYFDPKNEIGDHRSSAVISRAEVGRGAVAGAGAAGDDCLHERTASSDTFDGDDDLDDSGDDASDVGRSFASSSPLPTTSTTTTTTSTTSPAVDDDDPRSRRKAEKKRKKAERRAQREGCGNPAAGRKPCSLCGRPADLLVRCTYDESGAWVSSFVALFLGVPRRILSYFGRWRSE